MLLNDDSVSELLGGIVEGIVQMSTLIPHFPASVF
jgi:hypothetical protein